MGEREESEREVCHIPKPLGTGTGAAAVNRCSFPPGTWLVHGTFACAVWLTGFLVFASGCAHVASINLLLKL
eukprot:383977-Pelagomonas_calceolata.AAC.1